MNNYITTESKPNLIEYQINSEGLYVCSHSKCGKVFRYESEIKRHMIKHSKERPFECPIPGCTSVFKRKDIMNRHLRAHNLPDYSQFGPKRKVKQQKKPKFRIYNIDLDEEIKEIDKNLRQIPRHYLSQSTPLPTISSQSPTIEDLQEASTSHGAGEDYPKEYQFIDEVIQYESSQESQQQNNESQYIMKGYQSELDISFDFGSFEFENQNYNREPEQFEKYTFQEFETLLDSFDLERQYSDYFQSSRDNGMGQGE